jgi:pseudaminic acid cytidylyltransferase
VRNRAIVTARGGSKRIPFKNLKPFLGKPIIEYSIAAAQDSNLFDEIVVSTDDEEIADVARLLGASVPFMRSPGTSDDYATTTDVLLEVVSEFEARGSTSDFACCLYPTAPFVTGAKLRKAFAHMANDSADAVLPITAFSFPIWRSFRREGDLVFFNWPEHSQKRSQDLPPAYHDTGQFYFFRPEVLLRTGVLLNDRTVGIVVSELEAQDIDTDEDWHLAEIKYRKMIGENRQ